MSNELSSTPEIPWPTGRSRRSALISQFGESRAELMGWALTTGDPLADAVVAEIHQRGREVRVALAQGLAQGLASVQDPPPAVAALLTQTETVPGYVDDELLDTGSQAYFNSPPAASAISLSAGALVRVYDSPSIAKVLATSGRLVDGAARRLQETGSWVAAAMIPGALRVGAPGYVATLQVRMLHAHMRRLVRSRGYDETADGVPINQVDLGRTWMDFTVTSYRAEEVMGFTRTAGEMATIYRYWWYIAHLLGVDAKLVEGISSNDAATRVDELLQAVTGPPIPESSQLAFATLKSVASILHEVVSIPEGMGLQALYALTRRFHGHQVGDDLLLPRSAVADALLTPAISAIRGRRNRLRADPPAWQAMVAKNVQEAKDAQVRPAEPAEFAKQAQPEHPLV
jgi:hypothetical protein